MPSNDDPAVVILQRAAREQRRHERFGDDDACETCGKTTLVHLNQVADHVLCGCCLALTRGREILEIHHIPGHGQKPTIRICADCHAELSELQRDWPHGLTVTQRTAIGLADVAVVRTRRGTP